MNPIQDPLDRFMDKIFKHPNGCWIWIAGVNHAGYGYFRYDGQCRLAHRWSYEYHNGSLGGLYCLHKCNNPACVNPEHLYAGNQFSNMNDCVDSGNNVNANKLFCKHGHEFTASNTLIIKTSRHCKACAKIRYEKFYMKQSIPVLNIGTREININ